jgi:hypothetical protein
MRCGIAAATVALVAALSAACGTPAPSTAEGVSPATTAALRVVGRSQCLGSVPQVLRQVEGAAADTLEGLQATYENDPGFLGVVHDGKQAVIVVESGRVLEWQARMAPLGVAVAVSCVDPELLAAVQAALPLISEREEGVMSAGYDSLDDASRSSASIRTSWFAHSTASHPALAPRHLLPSPPGRFASTPDMGMSGVIDARCAR